jgi:multiple sugar transport system substrate-binding protein
LLWAGASSAVPERDLQATGSIRFPPQPAGRLGCTSCGQLPFSQGNSACSTRTRDVSPRGPGSRSGSTTSLGRILGWLNDPHTAPEKVLDLSTLAAEIGARHGGWWEAAEGCGRRADGTWISLPIAVSGNSVYCRCSWVLEAGFERVPSDPAGFLELCRALKRNGHPPGFALDNAVGDGNAWTHSVLWAFGSAVVDQGNQVIIDNPRTVEALEFARELHATFVPGTASWLDPDNNKAFLNGEIGLTQNGISLYHVARNSSDRRSRAIADDMSAERFFVGPVGRPTEAALVVNAYIFRHTRQADTAKAYLAHMLDTEQYGPWLSSSLGYVQPTLKAYDALPFWTSDPAVTPFRDTARNMLWYGYPGTLGRASAAVLADYVVVRMFAAVCSGGRSPADAAKEAQRHAERYYAAS